MEIFNGVIVVLVIASGVSIGGIAGFLFMTLVYNYYERDI